MRTSVENADFLVNGEFFHTDYTFELLESIVGFKINLRNYFLVFCDQFSMFQF